MKRGYNVFRRFCAFVLGAVFLISGILKFMDPVGSEFIMKSYFNFLHIGFMDFSAKFFGVAFALTEAVLGAALMSGADTRPADFQPCDGLWMLWRGHTSDSFADICQKCHFVRPVLRGIYPDA